MPARGLDHIVHAVRDLDAAADLYARLGFLVGARNVHPWGTHNRLVQLPGFFIEILTVAEPEKLGDDGFSRHFGRFHQDFLRAQEGLSMLLLESADPAAEAAETASIAAAPPMRFERTGTRADGAAVTLGFTLVFARDERAPGTGFALCHHHAPEHFWHVAFHDHANTAGAVAGVVLVAENPSDHHIFLSTLAGERDLRATSSGVTVKTPRGEIQALSPAAFESRFGRPAPDVRGGARLAALRIAVREPAAAEAALRSGGVAFAAQRGALVVGPGAARGATLVFEPA